MIEIRDILFSEKKNELFCFELKSKEPAVIAGLEKTQELLSNLNINPSLPLFNKNHQTTGIFGT
jgi:hypothetical protein